MKTCKKNPLKLNETRFEAEAHKKEGRYVKRYYFSNGLGASVACHSGTYGGHAGYFEVAILSTYRHRWRNHGEHLRHKSISILAVLMLLDGLTSEVDAILKQIRNYNTGEYGYVPREK